METGLFNVLGILLTYIFIRRYYGRLIGALAAALYAIGTVIVLYNRYIWQPNLVPPLVVAFMFCLYWGAVERWSEPFRADQKGSLQVLIRLLLKVNRGHNEP